MKEKLYKLELNRKEVNMELNDRLAKSLRELYAYVAVTDKVTPHGADRMETEDKMLKRAMRVLKAYDKQGGK